MIKKVLYNLFNRLVVNKKLIKYTNMLSKKIKLNTENKEMILFDYTSSYSVLISYYHIIKVLNDKQKISNFKYINNTYIKRLDQLKIPNINFDYFFNSIMSCLDNNGLFDKNIDKIELKKIVNSLQTKEEIVQYKIENLLVGDLIYDTYLRWNKKPTIDLDDKEGLFKIFIQAHSLFNQVKRIYLKNKQIKYYFTGDIAYIYSGITARYLAYKNITVINFIESNGLSFNFLDKDYFYRRNKYWNYSKKNILNLSLSRKLSKDTLKVKLEDGKQEYIYMKHNSFEKTNEYDDILKEIKKIDFKVFIPLHCFMDSPHLYRWIVYPDFYEWIVDTLKILEKQGIKAIVKPHPNGLPENDKIVSDLQKKFPYHLFIDKKISNRLFIDMKVDRVLTVYGSVGYEFSYFNIPVIAAGDNPHSGFNFVKTCSTQEEYKEIIKDIKNFTFNIDKNEIYDFYYLHYLNNNNIISGINPVYPFGSFERIIDKSESSNKQRERYHHSKKVLDIEVELINIGYYNSIEEEIKKKWF